MPNIISHTLFARELLEIPEIRHLITSPHLFEVGSNGPDFLFFHHFNLSDFYKSSPVRSIGGYLHKEKTNEFYAAAIRTIREEKNPVLKEKMISYICGHLAHLAFDCTAHPYVFYRTGNCNGRATRS